MEKIDRIQKHKKNIVLPSKFRVRNEKQSINFLFHAFFFLETKDHLLHKLVQ